MASGNLLILLLLAVYRKKYTEEAIRHHFFAQLMLAFSNVFVWVRLWVPLDIFAVLTTVPLIVSSYFEALALLGLSNTLTPKLKKRMRVPLVAGILLYCASVLIGLDPYIRVIVITIVNIVILLPAVLRVLFVQDDSSLRVVLGTLFVMMLAAMAFRIFDAIRLGPALVIFGPTLGEKLTVFSLYIYLILGGIGIILFAKENTDARLVRIAHFDEATGAFNRDGFIDAMVTAIDKVSYDNGAFSMLLVDIDGLNEINEEHGYVIGDGIIVNTGERLRAHVGSRGFIGRLSGDEFMVFVNGIDQQHLEDFVSALRSSVVANPPDGIACSVSIGAVAFDNPAGHDIHFPMIYATCADALKSAKKKGYSETVIALA